MRFRLWVGLVVASLALVTSCGDDGLALPSHDKDLLVQFQRITLASDTPDLLEIEIRVRTGGSFSEPAPDGTVVVLETTFGQFVGGGTGIEAPTHGGHTLVTLELPSTRPAAGQIKAKAGGMQTQMKIRIEHGGNMQLGST